MPLQGKVEFASGGMSYILAPHWKYRRTVSTQVNWDGTLILVIYIRTVKIAEHQLSSG